MNKVGAFFGLIRWVNLSYIALTQILVIFCLKSAEYQLNFDFNRHLLLVFSTICLAAAGYIINDYFDVKADEINKPNRIYINRIFKRRTAIIWHILLNFTGIAIGFYLAFTMGKWYLGFVHLIVWILLWYYSVSLKRKPFIGNLIVSIITALVVLVVYWFTIEGYLHKTFIWGYAIFAFLMNLQRELVKDMEDMEGDRSIGCKTLPIIWGISKTKQLTALVNIATIFSLVSFQVYQITKNTSNWQQPSWWLTIVCLQIPLLYLLLRLKNADRPINFKFISNGIKALMLMGILLLIVLKLEGTV